MRGKGNKNIKKTNNFSLPIHFAHGRKVYTQTKKDIWARKYLSIDCILWI